MFLWEIIVFVPRYISIALSKLPPHASRKNLACSTSLDVDSTNRATEASSIELPSIFLTMNLYMLHEMTFAKDLLVNSRGKIDPLGKLRNHDALIDELTHALHYSASTSR